MLLESKLSGHIVSASFIESPVIDVNSGLPVLAASACNEVELGRVMHESFPIDPLEFILYRIVDSDWHELDDLNQYGYDVGSEIEHRPNLPPRSDSAELDKRIAAAKVARSLAQPHCLGRRTWLARS
jgi:hypothetical protein